MRKPIVVIAAMVACCLPGVPGAFAGPWEDGMAAYNRGDYMPAIRLFRPLAAQGNPKAQSVIGTMYHKGEGVARDSVRAFVWFTVAASRGDARARTGLRDVQKTMTSDQLSQARAMAEACEASDYRNCEY